MLNIFAEEFSSKLYDLQQKMHPIRVFKYGGMGGLPPLEACPHPAIILRLFCSFVFFCGSLYVPILIGLSYCH